MGTIREIIVELEELVLREMCSLGYHSEHSYYDWYAGYTRSIFPDERDRAVGKAILANLRQKGEVDLGKLIAEDDGLVCGSGYYVTKKGMERVGFDAKTGEFVK